MSAGGPMPPRVCLRCGGPNDDTILPRCQTCGAEAIVYRGRSLSAIPAHEHAAYDRDNRQGERVIGGRVLPHPGAD